MPLARFAIAALAAVSLTVATPVSAETVTRYDRFQLWNKCGKMSILVESLDKNESKIKLTEKAITVAVRSRLRAARIYSENESLPYLYVNVNVFKSVYNVAIEYKKSVRDIATGIVSYAVTWDISSVGFHGNNESYILSNVSQSLDRFIDEYLRVNASACKS